jgi:hypothetical protein
LIIVSADDNNIYEIAYYVIESIFQMNLPEVQSIMWCGEITQPAQFTLQGRCGEDVTVQITIGDKKASCRDLWLVRTKLLETSDIYNVE